MNSKYWLNAIFSEFEQLVSLGTFKFLPYEAFPKGKRLITNRLVFKEKKDQYDNIVKFKARLIIKGFIQIEGLDYNKIFASTIIPPT